MVDNTIIYPKTYALSSQVYLDQYCKNYRNIIVINLPPEGPLLRHVRRIKLPRLSHFQEYNYCNNYGNNCNNQCAIAVTSLRSFMYPGAININNHHDNLMTPDEIPDLISFLTANGYNVDTQITRMMFQGEVKSNNSKLICYLTYTGRK